ncbi:MAG: NAD(P)H-binding protein [Methylobacterium sp.]|jgi:nucleoside-diphosphate-sugar epimerase|nr:NAD(P)H-binding protein [Methylobacterium sp.]MCA3603233.1 NAD(P)H-binding protein [Methylobacterium sp.]MCA3614267.1 NAD(P)H-binding protein [Methylobacterium sp.]MCA4908813.1 NAD(P)H-binding protein [Methylobacterium sp.]
MITLVAGASGFVGSRVVHALHSRLPGSVRAGLREDRADFARLGICQSIMDAARPATLPPALDGVTHVVNAIMASPAAMIGTTRNLLAAAQAAGVKRFVHLSSIAVFGGQEGLIRDDSPYGADVDAYGAAKIECERLVRASGLEWVILRPALIHGAGSEPWTARIGRLLRQRRLGDLAERGDGLCNLILVEDVVAAILAALDRPEAAGHAFNLADPDPVTWNRYLMDFALEIGATPVHRLPGWQWKVEKLAAIPLKLTAIARDKTKLGSLPVPDAITPGFARLFALDLRYDPAKADRLLGFPRTPHAEGLRRAAIWFASRR